MEKRLLKHNATYLQVLQAPYLAIAMLLCLLFYSSKTEAQTCDIVGPDSICVGQAANYSSAFNPSGPVSYQWSAFGGSVSGSGSSVTVSWFPGITAGQVTLVVRDALLNVLCTESFSVAILPQPTPAITPSYNVGCGIVDREKRPGQDGHGDACINACDSTWITYSTPMNPGSTYQWIIDGSAQWSPSSANEQEVYWTGLGIATVTVIETNVQGCVGEHDICVNVVGRPQSAFTTLPAPSQGLVSVCLGQEVIFLNQSQQGLGSPLYTYEWIWGDGNSTTQQAPAPSASHAFNTPGIFEVQLIVQNECRCKDTFSLQVHVDSLPGPEIFCISTVCPGTIVNYYSSEDCGSYVWSVDNGQIVGGATDSAVTIEWGSSGPGIITLDATQCGNACEAPVSAWVPIIPASAQIWGPNLLCIGETVTYRVQCDIPIDSILWSIPAGLTLQGGNPTNQHQISVTVTDSFVSGNIEVSYFHDIPGSTSPLDCGGIAILTVEARPRLFIPGQVEICEFEPVNVFPWSNSNTGISGNVQWNITGTGGTPLYLTQTLSGLTPLQTPPWLDGAGNYEIHVLGMNNQFCNSPQRMVLRVNPAPPAPDSIVGASPVCPGVPYNYMAFSGSSSNAILWEFSQGSPSESAGVTSSVIWQSNPVGPYLANAYLQDPVTGCISEPYTDTIASMLPLAASLISGADTACANSQGIYSVTDPGDVFQWSITPASAGSVIAGQGTQSAEIEWNHYTGNVTLFVERTICGQSVVSSKQIWVAPPPPPVINVPAIVCQGELFNLSTPTVAQSYFWDLGNGQTASQSSPVVQYNSPGTYFVQLGVVYGNHCDDTVSTVVEVIVNPAPNVSISTPDPNIFCGNPQNVTMHVASPAQGITYTWVQSPSTILISGPNATSYTTQALGNYFVTAVNSMGCSATSNMIRVDTICDSCAPDPAFSISFTSASQGCNTFNYTGSFTTGASSPSWSFDDPFSNPSSALGSTASHTFPEPGYYRVRFCVSVPSLNSSDSCRICATRVDTVRYVPDFYTSLSCQTSGYVLQTYNTTKILSGMPAPSYSWTLMPSGQTSSASEPAFNLNAGSHVLALTVDGVCVITDTIEVPATPVADFSALDSVCVGSPIAFQNASQNFSDYAWNLGDGSQSLVLHPQRTYSTAGTYQVTLWVTNPYGCTDSSSRSVVVMPNTLNATVTPGDSSICEGDSLLYEVVVSGGYAPYTYLWSHVQSTPQAWAQFTGSYFVDISDQLSCRLRTPPVNLMVNPTPKPALNGRKTICVGEFEMYSVNYPNNGYTFNWTILPANQNFTSGNSYGLFGNTPGNRTLIVEVVGPSGCIGSDTFDVQIVSNPSAMITPDTFPLCAGQTSMLVGSAQSLVPIVQSFWNNGVVGDTLISSVADQYIYTVVDSLGCMATDMLNIQPLPNFCGYKSGCYEICDTISELIWYAPKGYSAYQWFVDGSPIPGAEGDTLLVPLYLSGSYQVWVESAAGCGSMSPVSDIQFIQCASYPDCVWDIQDTIVCGPVDPNTGVQSYVVTLWVNNNLAPNANFTVIPNGGVVSNMNPGVLSTGLNTVTFTFTPTTPVSDVCFTIWKWNQVMRCDTVVCMKIPDCDLKPCEKEVKFVSADCAGNDADGNPLYWVCLDVNWGGNNGTQLIVNGVNAQVSPAVHTVNSGNQTVCFTLTDLNPASNTTQIYLTWVDTLSQMKCRDSVLVAYKPCPESCILRVLNKCAHCKRQGPTTVHYELELAIVNPFSTPANVLILPAAQGFLGNPTPATINPGLNTVMIPYSASLPLQDTILCFTVVINNGMGQVCTREVCMYLPPCDYLNINKQGSSLLAHSLQVAPNPANGSFDVLYNLNSKPEAPLKIEMRDLTGRIIMTQNASLQNGVVPFEVNGVASGTYIVRLVAGNTQYAFSRVVIAH